MHNGKPESAHFNPKAGASRTFFRSCKKRVLKKWFRLFPPPHPQRRIAFSLWQSTASKSLPRLLFSRTRPSRKELLPKGKARMSGDLHRQDHPALHHGIWNITEAELPACDLFILPLARTVGARGDVIVDDNSAIEELLSTSYLDESFQILLSGESYLNNQPVYKEGIFGLANGLGTSTFHWLFETLPRLELLRQGGYPWEQLDGLFLRRPKYAQHDATLDLLGVPREKIVWCTKGSHFLVDTLVAPAYPRDRARELMSPWVIEFLRRFTGEPLAEYAPRRRRILISRDDAPTNRRRVLNQQELSAALRDDFGFEEVYLGTMSFLEQVRLFASAEWIVGPHGGGMSNIVFSPPNARVIEIFTPDYTLPLFRNIAWECGLSYFALVAEAVQAGSEKGLLGENLVVDIPTVKATLLQMEKKSLVAVPRP